MTSKVVWGLVIAAGVCAAIVLNVVIGRDGRGPAALPQPRPGTGAQVEVDHHAAVSSQQPVGVRLSKEQVDRAYVSAVACLQASRLADIERLRSSQLNVGAESAPPMSPELRERWRQASRICGKEPPLDNAGAEKLALEAGLQGNVDAAICYASGTLKSRSHDSPPSKDGRYPLIAKGFIDQGVRAGNWSAVSIGAATNGVRFAGSPYLELPPPSPMLEHMYTKLKELGAEEEEKLDLQLVLLEQAKSLTEDQRFDAEAEASRLYSSYFTRSGPFAQDNLVLCGGF